MDGVWVPWIRWPAKRSPLKGLWTSYMSHWLMNGSCLPPWIAEYTALLIVLPAAAPSILFFQGTTECAFLPAFDLR